MKNKLTEKDIASLKYQGRMSYILSGMFFVLGSAIGFMIYEMEFNSEVAGFNFQIDLLIVSVFLLLSFLMSQALNRKYYADIRNNEKIAEIKLIERKNETSDVSHRETIKKTGAADRMRDYARYELIINNTRYRVEKDFFDKCNDGDEVIFFYAPVSKHLLSIEKK